MDQPQTDPTIRIGMDSGAFIMYRVHGSPTDIQGNPTVTKINATITRRFII
jgi:hypothetical protein